jgi:hypothetical protein
MKLAQKYSMVCGAGAFMLICYTGIFTLFSPMDMLNQLPSGGISSVDPMRLVQLMGLAIAGSCVAGFFGFQIGNIMGNPKGNVTTASAQSKSRRQMAEELLLAELEKAEASGMSKVAEEFFAEANANQPPSET